MNKLEKKLALCKWVRTHKAFTTVYKGFGFVVFNYDFKMQLIGLSKEVTIDCLKIHNTVPPEIVGFWIECRGHFTERMFTLPTSLEFVAEVLVSAFPELEL